MKLRLLPLLILAVLLGSTCRLQAKDGRGKKVHLHGTLIDNLCWNDRTEDPATLLRQHSKACLQMPDCVRSGYAIVTPDGKVYRMDAASDATTTRWIAATSHDADWRVDVKGRIELDGLLDVRKIQLQK